MASGTAGISQRLLTSQFMGRLRSRAPAFASLRRARRAAARGQHSSFELIELIDIRCSVVAVNGNDQREADSGFDCGDGAGEHCDHYPRGLGWFGAKTPEGGGVEICCGEH